MTITKLVLFGMLNVSIVWAADPSLIPPPEVFESDDEHLPLVRHPCFYANPPAYLNLPQGHSASDKLPPVEKSRIIPTTREHVE